MPPVAFRTLQSLLLVLAVTSASAAPESEIDSEITRLELKYTGNGTMIGLLSRLRRSWHDYSRDQCAFEKAVHSGGRIFIKGAPPEAVAAARACERRLRDQMMSVLARY